MSLSNHTKMFFACVLFFMAFFACKTVSQSPQNSHSTNNTNKNTVNTSVINLADSVVSGVYNVNDSFLLCFVDRNALAGTTYKIEIYNRWGQVIAKGEALSYCWNGKEILTNKYPVSGTYIFKAILTNAEKQRSISGAITLISNTR